MADQDILEASCSETNHDHSPADLQSIQKVLQTTLPDNMKKNERKQPTSARPSVWLMVNKDFSQCAEVHNYNEVYPGIILGDSKIAMDKDAVRHLGVTHVLNAAQGKKFNQINTDQAFYNFDGSLLTFMGINAIDVAQFKMNKHFESASEFIDRALQSGGKVLVHCQQGLSRSATLVLAYLIIKRSMHLCQAVRQLRKTRPVRPNDGFLQQLCDLNNTIHFPVTSD